MVMFAQLIALLVLCLIAQLLNGATEKYCVAQKDTSTQDHGTQINFGTNAWFFETAVSLSNGMRVVVCQVELNLTNYMHDFVYIVNFVMITKSVQETKIVMHEARLQIIAGKTPFSPMPSEIESGVLWSVIPRVILNHEAGTPRNRALQQRVRTILRIRSFSEVHVKMIFTARVPCKLGAFQCVQGLLCINSSLECDNNENCPSFYAHYASLSQSDESYCRRDRPYITISIIIVVTLLVIIFFFVVHVMRYFMGRQEYRRNLVGMTRGAARSVTPPQETVNAISSSFLPRSPPPYDRKAEKARAGGHQDPPSYDESEGPSVSAPKSASVTSRFAPRSNYTSSREHSLEEEVIPPAQ